MKNRKVDILHIYSGTSGVAGLYLHEIYRSLEESFKQEVIVSYYYPYNYGEKIFYKYSELGRRKNLLLKGKLRHYVRFIELLIASIKIYNYVLWRKVEIINYSLTTNVFIERWLLWFIKKTKRTKLFITCHDVNPFATFSTVEKEIEKKLRFFKLADKLIIHNDNSELDLKEIYNISSERIIRYPFPIMDLSEIKLSYKKVSDRSAEETVFSFVGHLRKDKGIDILLDAWKRFYKSDKNAKLVIAGNIPRTASYEFESIRKMNVQIINRFVDDNEYYSIIKNSDFVILPYKKGTNSGIPSSVLSLNKIPITSNIPMFINMTYLDDQLRFETENSNNLCKRLDFVYNLSNSERKVLLEKCKNKYDIFREIFKKDIILTFSKELT